MDAKDKIMLAAAIIGGGAAGVYASGVALGAAIGALAGIGGLVLAYMAADALDDAMRARYAPKTKSAKEDTASVL